MNPLRARTAFVQVDGAPTLTIVLVGGAKVVLPLSKIKGFTPSRLRLKDAAILDVRVEDRGASISFPRLDIDFSVAEKIPEFLGIKTASASARKAGSATSDAKRKASAVNGTRGGRPRKPVAA